MSLRAFFVLVVTSLVFLFSTCDLYSQNFEEINKVVASDRSWNDYSGWSVDISGNFAVVGSLNGDTDSEDLNPLEDAGAAYIYERNINGDWIEIQKIVASDREEDEVFGKSVSISGDHIVIGAPEESDLESYHSGAVYIFKRNDEGIWFETQKIVGSDTDGGDLFGISVEIENNTLVIGADRKHNWIIDDENYIWSGAAYVFEMEESGEWIEKQKLIASDPDYADYFGRSVSISDYQVVVGSPGSDLDPNNCDDTGAAYVFAKDSLDHWYEATKLIPTDCEEDDRFGQSVSISGDNILIGAHWKSNDDVIDGFQNHCGSAYLFRKDSIESWVEAQKVLASDKKQGAWFGISVSLDADCALIGASGESTDESGLNIFGSAGAVYHFEIDGTGYMYENHKLVASDRDGSSKMGIDVALSDGRFITGAYIESQDEDGLNPVPSAGAAYIFEKRCSEHSFSSLNIEACQSYTVPSGDTTYYTSQLVNDTIINHCGADSILTIELNILEPSYGIDTHIACDSFLWIDGNVYTESNSSSTYNLMNAQGCDSIVTLELTINNDTYSSDTQVACDTFLWMDGITYTESNYTANYVLANEVGCDSIITLKLTLDESTSSIDSYIACDSLTWIDGNTYTESNTNSMHALSTEAGCDSLIYLDLTIIDLDLGITVIANSLTANQSGAEYQWINCVDNSAIPGATDQEYIPSISGDYAVIVSMENCSEISDCESIIVTEINEIDNVPFELTIVPNPNLGQFILSSSALGGYYTVISVDGRIVHGERQISTEQELVNLSHLASGTYFVKINYNDFQKIEKMILH